MAVRLIVICTLFVLGACRSTEDRYWSDVATIIDHTQPKKGTAQ